MQSVKYKCRHNAKAIKKSKRRKKEEVITSRDLQEVSETRKNKTKSNILLQELSRCEI
jgi:hypothetical protein